MPLPEIGKALGTVKEMVLGWVESKEVPEVIKPELEQALKTLEDALEDYEKTTTAIGMKTEEGRGERKGVLMEVRELIQGYQEVQDQASELDVDLGTALKEYGLEWPESEGDLIRRADYWFPILRRAIPKAKELIRKISGHTAWRS